MFMLPPPCPAPQAPFAALERVLEPADEHALCLGMECAVPFLAVAAGLMPEAAGDSAAR